ncbi:MAG: histidine--tRNA ligase [Acidobacteriaceae bacterium]
MSQIKAVRGTRDLLPPETELWNRVEATARRVFERYAFGEIRTPIFEDTQLFARGVGEETDIVSKEMYTWEDGERFEKHLLQNAWREKSKGAGHFQGTNEPYIRLKKEGMIDEVFFRQQTNSLELISFMPKVTRGAVEDLRNAERKVGDWFTTSLSYRFRLVRRIVTPSGGTQIHDAFEVYGTELEELQGSYFKSSQSLTLRPENTAGVVRAYIEHKLGDSGLLQKLYYIGPQFRRERPQKGRYRQFYQIGAEVIGSVSAGSESPLRDAEVLEMLATFLDELGVSGWTLELNSVGSAQDRPRYVEALRAALTDVAPTLCVDCQRRAVTNPLRVLDCKVPEDQEKINGLPKIADFLDEASRAHFAAVLAALDACGVRYTVNPRLVRGLDYYTRTTFEFTHGGLGAQNALLGGGRYDGLSEAIGGPKAPGIGFAIGADRLVLTLQAAASGETASALADVYVAPLGEAQQAEALVLARELRRAGLRVELGDGSFRLKKSFEMGNKVARAIVLFGEDEAESGVMTVKDFASGEQKRVARGELAAILRSQ